MKKSLLRLSVLFVCIFGATNVASAVTCAAGTYLPANSETCTTCNGNTTSVGFYCPGGDFTPGSTEQGRLQCPDTQTHRRTTFPENYYNPTIISAQYTTLNGKSSIGACRALMWMRGGRGYLYEYVYYSSSTDKYDYTESYGYADVFAGYYLTQRGGCGTYAYYKQAEVCPQGYYCPGKTRVVCNSGNQAEVHTTTFGRESCPSDRPFSAPGATSINDCTAGKFTVTTTNLPANTEFKFYMTATGTFYVDCDGGTLSGTGVSGNTITRTSITEDLYTCTYTDGGVKTIKFDGTATGYSTVASYSGGVSAAIRFGYYDQNERPTPALIASVGGSLAQIFPYLGSANGQAPRFGSTFARCSNLTEIPGTLFGGFTGKTSYMFFQTFMLCTGLTSIPGNLFSDIRGDTTSYLFFRTFTGCSSLTSIPENLFQNITGGTASDVFGGTFSSCTSLTSIPSGLFRNITGGGNFMFSATFEGNTGLTSIPENLFAGITIGAQNLFRFVFEGCTNLSGCIPASAFAGLIVNGSPYNAGNGGMWDKAFYGTQLSTTTCPRGQEIVETGYEQYWDGRVAYTIPPPKIVTTSYVQGFYEEINTTKQDKLESGVNLITTGAPDGLVVSITADHGVVHVHKEEIQIPVGSVENPTGWLPIWVE